MGWSALPGTERSPYKEGRKSSLVRFLRGCGRGKGEMKSCLVAERVSYYQCWILTWGFLSRSRLS